MLAGYGGTKFWRCPLFSFLFPYLFFGKMFCSLFFTNKNWSHVASKTVANEYTLMFGQSNILHKKLNKHSREKVVHIVRIYEF